jgi:hypothetical protein
LPLNLMSGKYKSFSFARWETAYALKSVSALCNVGQNHRLSVYSFRFYHVTRLYLACPQCSWVSHSNVSLHSLSWTTLFKCLLNCRPLCFGLTLLLKGYSSTLDYTSIWLMVSLCFR